MSTQPRGFQHLILSRRRHHQRHSQNALSRGVDAITRFSGSLSFVVIHALWFGAWIVLNLLPGLTHFDPFPFGLLTLIVSLEAIFLSTFVLITQNKQADVDDARELADFQTNVLDETWTRMIGEKLGIEHDDVMKRYDESMQQYKQQAEQQGANPPQNMTQAP